MTWSQVRQSVVRDSEVEIAVSRKTGLVFWNKKRGRPCDASLIFQSKGHSSEFIDTYYPHVIVNSLLIGSKSSKRIILEMNTNIELSQIEA